jgi:ribonucleoside-diphosphate reductase alpha chain
MNMLKQPIAPNPKGQLLPTPQPPRTLRKIELSENGHSVFIRRYARRDMGGHPFEQVGETFWRVAYHIAKVESRWGKDEIEIAEEYYELLGSKRFFPNSPTFTGAGTPLGQLAACFVLPINDDMGKTSAGIFQTLRDAALIQQTGGGNGFSFSRLRPKHATVKASAGEASGPVGFLRVYDHAFNEIAQGGTRRGANMAVLRVDHPDIEDFITCKTDENAITNFNISVGVTDAFMQAVRNDEDWDLRFIDTTSLQYKDFFGTLEEAEAAGLPVAVHRTLRARDLFEKIVRQAHHNGEPGLLFLDAINRTNPLPHLYQIEATNPCGEQALGPYENCCLGSINLAEHFEPDGGVDWELLEDSVRLATRFLDDVIDANKYVAAIPHIEEVAKRARRIGLGIMGLADLMYHTGLRYGSTQGSAFAAHVMEFVRYHAMLTSIELAKERGPFPAIQGSIYDPQNLTWTPPKSDSPALDEFSRPALHWDKVVEGIKEHGIRNAAQTTVAPTGTIATVSGCEGYGCEPVFALAYIRHMDDNGVDFTLTYTSPLFETALIETGLDENARSKIIEQVVADGTCQNIPNLPERVKNTFVVSGDITAEEHVRMQAALQVFVDNSLSKTINFPEDASEEDVAQAYMLAWELGCKGITVYVTGSRDKVVLETLKVAGERSTPAAELPILWNKTKKPRPFALTGRTYTVETPVGKAFITINQNGERQPFEVFLNTAKAGSETAAVSEAIGRLISYLLRLASPISPRSRLWEIYRQLKGIGGIRSSGFGPNRVSSLPDGVAQVLGEYLNTTREDSDPQGKNEQDNGKPYGKTIEEEFTEIQGGMDVHQFGDICPECGHASVVNEEGCRKCYSCGFSEC